jgi:hypothetical protein
MNAITVEPVPDGMDGILCAHRNAIGTRRTGGMDTLEITLMSMATMEIDSDKNPGTTGAGSTEKPSH